MHTILPVASITHILIDHCRMSHGGLIGPARPPLDSIVNRISSVFAAPGPSVALTGLDQSPAPRLTTPASGYR